MSEFDNDQLNDPNFEGVLVEFCKMTSKKFSIFDIAPIIEALRQSKVLDYVIRSQNSSYINCLKMIFHNNPNLPQQFIGRFLAVINTEINVLPNNLRVGNQSYVTKVVARNVVPPVSVTNFTVTTLRRALQRDIRDKAIMHSVSTPNVIPNEIRLQMNQRTISMIVNSISDLCCSIVEGNRAQGRDIDPYIRSQIKYSI